jgi:hypothetical protein
VDNDVFAEKLVADSVASSGNERPKSIAVVVDFMSPRADHDDVVVLRQVLPLSRESSRHCYVVGVHAGNQGGIRHVDRSP